MDYDWFKIISGIAAVLAALFSGLKLWLDYKEKKRQIKVKLSMGLMPTVSQSWVIMLNVMNPGNRTVRINVPSILLPNKGGSVYILSGNVQFPYDLPEGKDCCVWMSAKELALELKKRFF